MHRVRPARSAHPTVTVRRALQAGIAVPFLYYGTQLLAALFYPHYSFLTQTASMLGSDLARYPWIFNSGAFVVGVATLFASYGFLRALRQAGARTVLAWLCCIAIAINGMVAIKAGYFPLPDPRHGSGPLMIGILALPALLAAALWQHRRANAPACALVAYLVATNFLIVAMIPVMSGMTGLDTRDVTGALQRVATLTIYPPVGVTAWYLLRTQASPADF